MTENVKTYVTEKTKELIAATSCSAEAKEAANAWLEAVGTEKEAEVTKIILQNWKKISCRSMD